MFCFLNFVACKSLWSIGIQSTILMSIFYCSFLIYFYMKKDRNAIGFFHPGCTALGGGERVLWAIVKAVLDETEKLGTLIYVYTDSQYMVTEKIFNDLKVYFNIDLTKKNYKQTYHEDQQLLEINSRLIFVPLRTARFLDHRMYSGGTLFFLALASVITAFEALLRATPAIFVETAGWTFTGMVARCIALCSCHTYIHYPMIGPSLLPYKPGESRIRWMYHNILAKLYRYAANRFDTLTVNSSWTLGHIQTLMSFEPRNSKGSRQAWLSMLDGIKKRHSFFRIPPTRLFLLYPPCDLDQFDKYKKTWDHRSNIVVSLGHFRPEKNHVMQLHIIQHMLGIDKDHDKKPKQQNLPHNFLFCIAGGAYNPQDEAFVNYLKQECINLKIAEFVDFRINSTLEDLKTLLHSAKIGVHTMVAEHFGIALIEMLAAGLFVVSHDSGGPATDILVDRANTIVSTRDVSSKDFAKYRIGDYGYLASTVEGFATAIQDCLNPKHAKSTQMILKKAKASLNRFKTSESFGLAYLDSVELQRTLKINDTASRQKKSS